MICSDKQRFLAGWTLSFRENKKGKLIRFLLKKVVRSVEVAMKPVYFHHIRGVKLSEEELAKAVAGAVGVFKIVETFLENGGGAYLVGDFSIADICIGAQLHRFYTLNIERPTLPKLQAYYNLLKTRPLYEKLILNERFV